MGEKPDVGKIVAGTAGSLLGAAALAPIPGGAVIGGIAGQVVAELVYEEVREEIHEARERRERRAAD